MISGSVIKHRGVWFYMRKGLQSRDVIQVIMTNVHKHSKSYCYCTRHLTAISMSVSYYSSKG